MSEQLYRIKPLEWKMEYNFPNEQELKAETTLTTFMVDFEIDTNAHVTYWWGYIDEYHCRDMNPCDSVEDGKAKAEAYYRNKLMQMLEPV